MKIRFGRKRGGRGGGARKEEREAREACRVGGVFAFAFSE